MAFNPRTFFPIFDGREGNDSVLAQPIIVVRTYQVSPNWDQSQGPAIAADQVEQYYTPTIANFVDRARDYSQRSGLDSTRTNLVLDGMTLRYERVFGIEKLFINAVPESFGGGIATEVNYDGYIMVVNRAYQPGPNIIDTNLSFDCQLNDKSIGTFDFQTSKDACIIFTFGLTALKLHSLADIDNPPPPVGSAPPGNPNTLVKAILPPRQDIKSFANTGATYIDNNYEVGDPQVAKHPDLPLYAMYDWNGLLNQHNVKPPHGYNITTFPKPQIVNMTQEQIKYLKNAGLNKFRCNLKTTVHYKNTAFLMLQAEFYDRFYFRNVFQSWTKTVSPPAQITINDTPLYFAINSNLAPVLPLDIDLSPTKINGVSKTLDRTTPTPYSAFEKPPDGLDDNLLMTYYGKPPYCAGYWRIGDRQSYYNGPSRDPWVFVTPVVQGYYTNLSAIDDFINDKYQPGETYTFSGTDPQGNEVATTVVVGPNFFYPSWLSEINVKGELIPQSEIALREQFQSLIKGQLNTWKNNYTTADDNLTSKDSFFGDPASTQMLSDLRDDSITLCNFMIGVIKLPYYDEFSNPYVPASQFFLNEIAGYAHINPTLNAGSQYGISNDVANLIEAGYVLRGQLWLEFAGILLDYPMYSASDDAIKTQRSLVEAIANYKLYDPNDETGS